MEENKDNYLIDVAKDKTYQNQFDDYHELFSKWRGDEKNPYGYKFVHDIREHTYMDGEGYIQKKADIAERMALLKCVSLLGIVLLIMISIDVFRYLLLDNLFHDSTADVIYFSEKTTKPDVFTVGTVCLDCGIVLFKLLLGIGIFKLVTKIPYRVISPRNRRKSEFLISGIVLTMMLMVMGRTCSYGMNNIFGIVKLDTVYSNMIFSGNELVNIVYVVLDCFVIAAVSEVFFRGVILQTFRQFGDIFAIIISSVTYAMCFYDFASIGYALLSSLILGLFTIKTGSLKTAIAMQVTATFANYVLSGLSLYHSTYGTILEIVICTIILGVSVLILSRLIGNEKWSFNIKNDDSQLSITNKLKTCATTVSFALWIVCVIALVTVTLRWL